MNEIVTSGQSLPDSIEDLSRFVLVGRERLTAVRAAIRAIDKVGVAAEVYQQKLAEGQEIAEAVLDAEVRLGELRASVPREKGGRPEKTLPDDRTSFSTSIQEFDSIVGFGKSVMSDIERVSARPDIVERAKAEAREAGRIVTRQDVLNAIKAEKRNELREERKTNIDQQIKHADQSIDLYNSPRKYRVIYADPPWQYGDKQDIETLGGAQKHYPTMSLEDIIALPVPSEDNAVLFLWTTSPLLEDSFKVINGWGFKYKSSFIWDKVAHNMGHYNSVRHEFLLIATKGSCTPDVKKLFDSVQSIERTEHSRKPEEFRDIIDTLYTHGNKLEMFARTAHPGWDAWGNMV